MSLSSVFHGWSTRRTIRQQLTTTATISLVLFFGALVIFAHTTNRLLASLYESHRLEETLAAGKNLRRLLPSVETAVTAYAASGRPEFLLAYRTAGQAYQYETEHVYTLVVDDPPARQRFEKVLRYSDHWTSEYAARAVHDRRVLGRPEAWRAILESPEAHSTLLNFYNELDLFLDWQQQRLSDLRAEAEADVRRMVYLTLFLGVLGSLGTLWWTGWLGRTLTGPLDTLLAAGERIEAGRPVPPFTFDRPPEMVRLAENLHRVGGALEQVRAELEAFQHFVDRSPRSQGVDEIHRTFLHTTLSRFHPENVFILSADRESSLLEISAQLVPSVADTPTVMTQPLACPAVRTSKPFGVCDTAAEPVCQCEIQVPNTGSYFCAPLLRGGNLVGLVSVTGPARHWDEPRRQHLLRYTDHLARELATQSRLVHAQTQAMVDELTGLYNRRFAEEYLHKLIALSRRSRRSFAVLLIDIDHFKLWNDRFGHAAGDRLLRAFATAVLGTLRQSAIAARWGGEEFLVILPESEGEGALKVAERLRASVAETRLAEADATGVTISIGISVFPLHAGEETGLLGAADRALYRAKADGRNRIVMADSSLTVAL
ncbi:MAG TPA: diguanylate cyclase [Candidatus Acidoferrales bacterium]|nr:diguanylate cyclase [Candidatus Acidoferrales bacterium]